jgi:hypothetical protein
MLTLSMFSNVIESEIRYPIAIGCNRAVQRAWANTIASNQQRSLTPYNHTSYAVSV